MATNTPTSPGQSGMIYKSMQVHRGFVSRTDLASKNLFTLPKYARLIAWMVWGKAASDALTTANISIGKLGGTGVEFLSAFDVKTVGTGNGMVVPNAQLLMGYDTAPVDTAKLSADTTVTAKYAETGAASTVGGPWTITLLYVTGMQNET